jgi:hypothetical protein
MLEELTAGGSVMGGLDVSREVGELKHLHFAGQFGQNLERCGRAIVVEIDE